MHDAELRSGIFIQKTSKTRWVELSTKIVSILYLKLINLNNIILNTLNILSKYNITIYVIRHYLSIVPHGTMVHKYAKWRWSFSSFASHNVYQWPLPPDDLKNDNTVEDILPACDMLLQPLSAASKPLFLLLVWHWRIWIGVLWKLHSWSNTFKLILDQGFRDPCFRYKKHVLFQLPGFCMKAKFIEKKLYFVARQ